ncbi:hypothetical protein ACFX2H_015358 [Malus domestica]
MLYYLLVYILAICIHIIGASIIPYEIEYEGDHYGERTKCSLVPYLGNLKRRAMMHFRNSSNIKHENLLNAKPVAFDEVEEQWYIFYDEFKCPFDQQSRLYQEMVENVR